MPDLEKFNAVVIGTGQGGKPLAGALADAGRRVAIVERGRVGGTCVVCGCTPTKTMVASARVAHLARRAADYGVATGDVTVDLERVRRRKREIVDQWSNGSRKGLERHDTLDLIHGSARFASPTELTVTLADGGARRLAADHVFINAGARPRIPPLSGLDDVPYLTSTSIMELDRAPEHLIVLGGGFIGLEFAQMFRRFGSDVTVVEQDARLVSREDEDVSDAMAEIFRGEGIDVRTGTAASGVSGGDGDLALTVEAGGKQAAIRGTHILIATGRQPNSDTLNLGAASLETDERGFLPVDDHCRTGVPGIWALGDITGAPPFTHVSYDDYRVIESALLGGGERTRAGRLLSYAVFTDPQLGRVGITEREAREGGLRIRVAKLPMTRVARAIEVDETRGFMKAVVEADSGRILGAAVLGLEGGEVVTAIQIAMMGGLPYTAIRDAVLPHPTLAESLNNLFMTLD